jgi:RNA polymerase sigma-70 factor, ECF subfamily
MDEEIDRRTAFEDLFSTHYRAVRAYAMRRGAGAALEDVLAETFLVAWRRVDEVPADPLPWLLGTARRVLANQRRGGRRRAALGNRLREDLATDPGGGLSLPPGLSDELAAALAKLSDRQREALLLVAWEGLSPQQAACAAGCSAATFRVRFHRARQQVAAHLADLYTTSPPKEQTP